MRSMERDVSSCYFQTYQTHLLSGNPTPQWKIRQFGLGISQLARFDDTAG